MRNCITVAAMAATIAMTAFAADVSGKWTGQMPGRNGQTREVTYTFKADGDKLTGTMSLAQGEIEIKEGKISGDNISFKVPVEFGGNAFVLVFKGTVSGDQIKFTRSREGADQTQEFTAKRTS
jgi:hypothetical protein